MNITFYPDARMYFCNSELAYSAVKISSHTAIINSEYLNLRHNHAADHR